MFNVSGIFVFSASLNNFGRRLLAFSLELFNNFTGMPPNLGDFPFTEFLLAVSLSLPPSLTKFCSVPFLAYFSFLPFFSMALPAQSGPWPLI
jgi:hypothetical protein